MKEKKFGRYLLLAVVAFWLARHWPEVKQGIRDGWQEGYESVRKP